MGGPDRWTDADRARVAEYLRWRAEFCPQCGTRNRDWTDEHGRRLVRPPYGLAYDECIGCHYKHDRADADPPEPWEIVAYVPARDDDTLPVEPVTVPAMRVLRERMRSAARPRR